MEDVTCPTPQNAEGFHSWIPTIYVHYICTRPTLQVQYPGWCDPNTGFYIQQRERTKQELY